MGSRFELGLMATAAMLAGAAVPAFAQSSRLASDNAPIDAGSLDIAPLAERGFDLDAILRTVYDDNVLRLDKGEPLLPGESRADFRFTPSVIARIGVPFGRQRLFAGAQLGKDFYARNTQLDRQRISGNAGVQWRLGSRCSGTVAGEYRERQNTVDEVDRVVDNVQQTQSYGANASCSRGIGLGFGGSVERVIVDNERPQRQIYNSEETNFTGRVFYQTAASGVLSLSGSYNDIAYPNRLTLVAAPGGAVTFAEDGTEVYNLNLTYSRSIGPRLSASIGASYINVKPASVFVSDFTGPGFNASLTYRPGTRLTLGLSGSRRATSTANTSASYVLDTELGFDASYQVGPSITTGVYASYSYRDYRGGVPSADEPIPRDNQTNYRLAGVLTYRPTKLYDIDFELAHQRRSSNPAQFDYEGTSAALTLRVHF